MIPNFKLLLIPLLLIGSAARGFAQAAVATSVERETVRSLSLNEALQRSLRSNPEIAKLDSALANKLGRAIEAEVKLNPAFKV
ncbi:MAG: hypothetical protein H0W04_08925, partial [Chthoniobacterales bacterium]|nr:hypothetical protein [Chthoniobacterales bacterium]